ncbi:MAG TPA: heme-binding protein [Alphaproteobacteria bacterium]|nr:heme-binding protein [Alphaproteobacteria bacterium]
MRSKPLLTSSDAHTVMTACKTAAIATGWKVSIAIVDDGGYPLLLERMDGAGLLTPEVALRKARTAALSRAPTKNLEDRLRDRPAFLSLGEYLPLQGGLPIKIGDDCLGGVGVSGVQSHEDEQIAAAGISALQV